MALHWLTQWDPKGGEPHGQLCNCRIGQDHNGYGEVIPDPFEDEGDELRGRS